MVHDYLKIIAMGKVSWNVAHVENSLGDWEIAALSELSSRPYDTS